jgi:SAM-dependent methyltransferase
MHPSVFTWGCRVLRRHASPGARWLEVGSLNVNGSLRTYAERFTRPRWYYGIDRIPGPGVDALADAADLKDQVADVVITTEMLEHAPDWRAALAGCKRAVAIGGLLLLTTRGPGFPRHEYPGDHWRFTVELLALACRDLALLTVQPDTDPGSPGVFLLGRREVDPWVELRDLEAVPAP